MLFDQTYAEILDPYSSCYDPGQVSYNLNGFGLNFYGCYLGFSKRDKIRALENETLRELRI